MIVFTFKADGTMTRQPIGYAGGTCHKATAPYEQFDVPGTTTKTPTADACRTEAKTEVEQELNVGEG